MEGPSFSHQENRWLSCCWLTEKKFCPVFPIFKMQSLLFQYKTNLTFWFWTSYSSGGLFSSVQYSTESKQNNFSVPCAHGCNFFCGRFLQTALLFIALGFEDALCFSSSGVPNVCMLPVCLYLLTLLPSGAICSHTGKIEGISPQPFIPFARWPAVHGQLDSFIPEGLST